MCSSSQTRRRVRTRHVDILRPSLEKVVPVLRVVLGLVFLYLAVTPYKASTPAGNDEKQRLLAPAALETTPPPASMDELRRNFQDPPAEFRTAPLWVWNDEMDPDRMREQLRQFKEQGMGGVFIHPRPGLITEYLGREWFDLWKVALEESKRLGLLSNIYDENSYPSGFAGGHVPAIAPDTAGQYVQAQIVDRVSGADGPATLAVFLLVRDASGRIVEAVRSDASSRAEAPNQFAVFALRHSSGSPWTGQFPYVDLTNPETARQFLATTYEPYRKHFGGEFGKAIKWAFDDEPLLATAGAYEQGEMSLPISYYILAEFEKRNGYDLRSVLPALFWDVGEWGKARFDYWQTLHDLWKENYFQPIFEWCDRNNLQFTGHFMEHEWPYPWISPDDASLAAYMHMPGIDMLVGVDLRTKGADPHMLFTIRQLASVSHQLGRRAFSETYGVAGWDSTLEHYKRMGDWLLVNGIDFIDQHLAFTTIRGARKRDHPQSFSDISAWWPYYRLHADHTARLSYLLAQTEPRNRVLVLEPTTSGFLWARRGGETQELARLRESYDQLNQFLADHQIDFDLGDEYLIEWLGSAAGGRLGIGKATYDLVVWPENMINLRRQTLPVLQAYLEGGGAILALGEPAAFVDGRASDAAKRLQERFASRWQSVAGLPALLEAIRRRLPPRVVFDQALPVGVGHQMLRTRDGGTFHLFTNAGLKPVSVRAKVEGAALEEWMTTTGEAIPVPFRATGPQHVEFDLDLLPAGARLLSVSRELAKAPVAARSQKPRKLPLGEWKITRASENVLALDYCDLRLAGKSYENINTWAANWKIWQAHGFERPAWDNAIQFRRRILELPPFGPDSGFEATFRFVVADAAVLKGAQLAIESPELYKVTVNGGPMEFSRGARWLDPHLKSLPVEPLLKIGENTVRLIGMPFDVHMELENIYIRGDFTVQPEERGFSLRAPRTLETGSWAKLGLPFYYDSMLYEAPVEVPKGTRVLRISLPDWQGSVAQVLLDGRPVATLGWQPYACETTVTPGTHTVGVRVVSTPRNLFGPFHNPTKPRMIAWPGAWSKFPEHQPAGREYDLLDYGLMKPFEVEAMR